MRINTAANSEATFVLQYEELIIRRRSKYRQIISLNPGAVVEDFAVWVRVADPQGVINETASYFVDTDRISENEVLFSYSPTEEQQREDSIYGLARDLSVEYDVVHLPNHAGTFVVDSNCYFAQFFSPAGVATFPVDLVFVIDVSGSMSGTKIIQTRQALETIINELRATDRFNMLTFSNDVSHWKPTLVSVSEFRGQAVEFARSLVTIASTNFNDGVLEGAEVLKTHGRDDHVPLLVILTDGEPTVGVVNENTIVDNVGRALAGTRISLNCLGFGNNLNFRLLERLALKNNGIVRRIYEARDAPEQLEGFFEEISSPVLRDIRITYDSQSVSSVTITEFPLYFNGGEIVVAGECDKSNPVINVEVSGTGGEGPVMYQTAVSTTPSNTVGDYAPSPERLLAYLLIQQLLQSRLTETDEEVISDNVERALQLSLEYNFVTELTSLIVVEETGSGSGSDAQNESIIGGNNPFDGGLEDDVAFFSPGVASELMALPCLLIMSLFHC